VRLAKYGKRTGSATIRADDLFLFARTLRAALIPKRVVFCVALRISYRSVANRRFRAGGGRHGKIQTRQSGDNVGQCLGIAALGCRSGCCSLPQRLKSECDLGTCGCESGCGPQKPRRTEHNLSESMGYVTVCDFHSKANNSPCLL
jgi:hypothetical protein